MVQEIKDLRKEIDGLAFLTKELKPVKVYNFGEHSVIGQPISEYNKQSKEIEKTYDSLILAKAWLGKVLEELGESTPYNKDGKRKTIEDIEPTADTAKVTPGMIDVVPKTSDEKYKCVDTFELNCKNMNDYVAASHIEKVDWLREEIKHITHIVYQACVNNSKIKSHSEICYKHLCEARFWLGFELQRIKND
jgi:hypothetical protein